MQTVNTIGAARAALAACRQQGKSIGIVPTMGYLHDGHLQLVARARDENDVVVASIFVNPLQFGPTEDLSRYPRDLERDTALLEAAGVDIVFAPGTTDMYPQPMKTVVDVPDLGNALEGAARPGHFAGVTTVVSKLFNIIQPTSAYFGEKDYQQVALIQRMVYDLALPVTVVPVPTVRDTDGLALSSRNSYLSETERAAAVIVPRALSEAERLRNSGIESPAELEAAIRAFIAREPLASPEIVAIRHPLTLKPLATLRDQEALVALVVRIGTTRLIDNLVIGAAIAGKEKAA